MSSMKQCKHIDRNFSLKSEKKIEKNFCIFNKNHIVTCRYAENVKGNVETKNVKANVKTENVANNEFDDVLFLRKTIAY